AKAVNFAKAFGAGVQKFAAMIDKPEAEAVALYRRYGRGLPFVGLLAKRCTDLAANRGYLKLYDGARRHWDAGIPTHKAMNALIQGSAARHTKLWMRACWREGIVPLLQMHDALDCSVTCREQAERVAQLGREAVTLKVPIQVDLKFGRTWGDAK